MESTAITTKQAIGIDASKKVAVLGLGSMGSVLAKLLIENGMDVSIWNRTPEKANQPGLQQGRFSVDIHEVIRAVPIVIICVKDYNATIDLLKGVSLTGKTVIQLSTGTPQDARQLADQVQQRGAAYLDGAILATPSQMGRPDTPIFFSGSKQVFEENEELLRVFGGTLIYVGEGAGAASAWDFSVLISMFGMMTGFLHGARIMEAEGMKASDLGNMIFSIAPVLGQMIKDTGEDINQERFTEPQSSVDICAQSFELMVRQANESNINATFPTYLLNFFNKGRAAGLGQERISALIKIMRKEK